MALSPNDAMMARELAKRGLLPFSIATNPEFQVGPHHEKIAAALEAVERGDLKRLMIFAPPRHGKSLLASTYFPAWCMGRNPKRRFILATYGQELATDFGRNIRNTMLGEPYQFVFPGTVLANDSKAAHRFHTAQGGGLFAMGRGGALTGRGYDIGLIDDPIKDRKDALSDAVKKDTWDWYRSVFVTRQMKKAAIIVILTRWAEDDLAGKILSQPGAKDEWTQISLPALSPTNQPLWPEMFDIAQLEGIKKDIGEMEWAALYQQRPAPAEGNMILRKWIQFYKELPGRLTDHVISVDAAFKDTDGSDFVVLQCWGKDGANRYLIDQVRDRMGFVETLRAVEAFCRKHPYARKRYIEEKANGAAILDSLRNRIDGLIPVIPKESKLARLAAVSPTFQSMNVYFPDPSIAPWVDYAVEELVGFPTAAHDDVVDACSQALNEMRTNDEMLRKLQSLARG